MYTGSGEKSFPKDFTTDYHIYGLEWEQNEIRWTIDGQVYHTENINRIMWSGRGPNPYNRNGQPFDKPFHIIFCVAVGGSFFPQQEYGPPITLDEARRWPKPTMEIDYIRVYQKQ